MTHDLKAIGAASAVVVLLGGLLATTVSPSVAHAIGGRRCLVWTYYNDPSHKDEVGQRGSCPGGDSWGRVTPYYTTSSFTVEPPGVVQAPAGPAMPCEFRAGEPACLYLPNR
jgi:hypothetical protein